MNNILKAVVRLNSARSLLKPVKKLPSAFAFQHRQITRNLWYMCRDEHHKPMLSASQTCSCGCGKQVHSKAEKELIEFLTEEILAERKAQQVKSIPTEIDGFKASLNGAEVTLCKESAGEKIKITFNVNNTVDTDVEQEIHENADRQPELGELKSKPAFKVELIKGNTTVSLICSFITAGDQEEGYNDVFGIDEISIHDGEWNENVYSVSGEIVDSNLYDLLLNYLEEKGVTNEFVEKISNYSTAYEHSAYIGLLEGLSKYASLK